MSIEEKNNSKCEISIVKEKSDVNKDQPKNEEKKESEMETENIQQKNENEKKETESKQEKENNQNDKTQIPQNIKTEQNEENQEHKKVNEANPKKKDWSTWSAQEKILFYEIIANGGNYSSLQKLFKTMNYVSLNNII